jgi:branched-chain amino acid transport system permease protein
MNLGRFTLSCLVLVAVAGLATRMGLNDYAFFAAYIVAQYIVLATAWNILGGYAGYVNFGIAGFFGIGVYSTVVLNQLMPLPLPLYVLIAAIVAGLAGLATGYLTLRLRGVFFSIATLGLAVVLQTFVLNWDFVGGARGITLVRPATTAWFGNYTQLLFFEMTALAVGAVWVARWIERSWVGRGLAALRDDEQAAECAGVATLRLKLLATTISGALMGAAGASYPLYVGYVDPYSTFSLVLAVNTLAMPLIGGTSNWRGPVIGAVLLSLVQVATGVTAFSQWSALIVGILLVLFVIVAPNGLLGLFRRAAVRPAEQRT